MGVNIRIPTPLRKFTDEQSIVAIESAQTVGAALGELAQRYPELKERVFKEDGSVRRFVNVFANDEDIRFLEQLDTALVEGDEISIIPAIAGG